MNSYLNNNFIDTCIDKIQTLAALSIYGESVKMGVRVSLYKACDYLILNKIENTKSNLLILKERLMMLANATHSNLPNYKKVLIYAASLIDIDSIVISVPMSKLYN